MNINIRAARKEDCPQMLELVRELAVYERAPTEVTVTLEHFEDTGFGKEPVWWAFVAIIPSEGAKNGYNITLDVTSSELTQKVTGQKERIVGFALYYIRYSTWKGKKMYLEDILVTEEWRGKGIGTRLMNTLIDEAKQKDFQGITWQVLEWNEPAFRFYNQFNVQLDPEWVNARIDLR